MNEPAGNEPVPLVTLTDGGRVKDQVIDDLLVGKRRKRYHAGEQQYDDGYGDHEAILIIKLQIGGKLEIANCRLQIEFIFSNLQSAICNLQFPNHTWWYF
jgi:hypothetical protein